ncbi:adenosylmethionine decarboxylase [Ascidiimonas sp. W6]|uniref:adenosylmethionine decarboxylase n=1 Tax=Ascidiimonas meishanensis TaxID=3128903 RepID=UPI0030EF6EBE
MSIGYHYIWDIHGCDEATISFTPFIDGLLHEIIDELNLSKVQSAFKQFQPVGVTGFILLEESHISIHTWPEHKFAAIDIFSCKPIEISKLKTYLLDKFRADLIETSSMKRGRIPTPSVK